MKRLALAAFLLAACGGGGDDDGNNATNPLDYADPPAGGLLRLVKNKDSSTKTSVALDLIVGDQPLTGYSTGLDLPMTRGLATFTTFTPGTALDPGSAPAAAQALVPVDGPLAGMLVVGLSQKSAGTGAVPNDASLAPKAVLFTVRFDLVDGASPGIVFDGTASGFVLPSGGLRDRAGLTVVEPKDVAIGKMLVNAP
jgi:hypothetical protein